LLRQADIVVTNPPFSLFREYVAQLVEHGKKFLIIANKNAITYKEIFRLIKDNKLWMGVHEPDVGLMCSSMSLPKSQRPCLSLARRGATTESSSKDCHASALRCWFTNLDHGRRHQNLPLMTMDEKLEVQQAQGHQGQGGNTTATTTTTPSKCRSYEAIPSDYDGVMGVPILPR
jgi:hypothetical protein